MNSAAQGYVIESISQPVLLLLKLTRYTVAGPNNEIKITKKIRYFTTFSENNQITNLKKLPFLSRNFPKVSNRVHVGNSL